ncbi:MAG TPA: ABC transporter substrate-binding protein, partial [Candidatus Nanoarchaeia archaeon]|nr:ABC transporter substrate-binding protein [Candidatus Nanoarchaeia archaeon]
DKVTAIVGGLCSSETMAIAPVAEQQKVILFSYCSSSPGVTSAGDYVFRTYPSDAFQGVYAANMAQDKLNAKNVAILYCLSDWCVGIKDVFKKTFTAADGKIVAEEGYEQTTNDLKTQLSKIKEKNPDLIYFVGYTEASIIGLKQMKELDMDVQTLGADAWEDANIWTDTGAAGEGKMWTVVSSEISDTFKAKMQTIGVNEVTLCSPQSYDATMILTNAMKKVGTDTTKIKDELYKVKDYQGVSGVISFDSNGDLASASYVTKVVKEGKGEILYK